MTRIRVYFKQDAVRMPVLAKTILSTNVPINVIRAEVSEEGGFMTLDVPDNAAHIVIEAFRKFNVDVHEATAFIEILPSCIDCGFCCSVCPTKALTWSRQTARLSFDEKKCVGCGACIRVCPVRAIRQMF